MTDYVKCPRCRGRRYVSAMTHSGDGVFPSRYEEFPCPLCLMTAECSTEDAAEFERERAEACD